MHSIVLVVLAPTYPNIIQSANAPENTLSLKSRSSRVTKNM